MESNSKIDIEYIKSTYDKNNTFHQSVLKFIDMIESCDKPDSDIDKVRWQNLIEQIILLTYNNSKKYEKEHNL
jgi:hypothetical protein